MFTHLGPFQVVSQPFVLHLEALHLVPVDAAPSHLSITNGRLIVHPFKPHTRTGQSYPHPSHVIIIIIRSVAASAHNGTMARQLVRKNADDFGLCGRILFRILLIWFGSGFGGPNGNLWKRKFNCVNYGQFFYESSTGQPDI